MQIPKRSRRRLLAAVTNLVLIAASIITAFLLRFDFVIDPRQRWLLVEGCAVALVVKGLVFAVGGLHNGWTRHAGFQDAGRIVAVNVLATGAFFVATRLTVGTAFPRSVYIIDLMLATGLIGLLRFQLRLFNEVVRWDYGRRRRAGVLLYGAGETGISVLRQLQGSDRLNLRPVGFLDDDPAKQQTSVYGLPVLGAGKDAVSVVEELRGDGFSIEQVIVAMPSATSEQMRAAVENCRAAGLRCRTVPSLAELVTGGPNVASRIRDVSVLDLLGRRPVELDNERIRQALRGRRILVTGAAGSIGSEVCRQVLRFEPATLVALDQAESALFEIEIELREKFAASNIVAKICDIRDRASVESFLREQEIDVVFHAAAYKHVPLMEAHPLEVARANVVGTFNLVRAASRYGISTFVMISSDKAVNPTNLMGLTKRVAELLVTCMETLPENQTKFVSVRFGNVLGSNGSVFPLFQKQIAAGGPVTVTHPEVRRFFMTTNEAVQLVLQVSIMGNRSEIFVLDMGELMKVDDLARKMIELAGLEPDSDIRVEYVGLRPGEKLYEEVITRGERVQPTHHDKIKVFRGPSESADRMMEWMRRLELLLERRDEEGVVAHMSALVPEYRPSLQWEPACMREDGPAGQVVEIAQSAHAGAASN
jgi:FlaA1/EpsC-like NDP-sugar epimerase